MIALLERDVAMTRVGARGAWRRRKHVRGVIATAYDHYDSRPRIHNSTRTLSSPTAQAAWRLSGARSILALSTPPSLHGALQRVPGPSHLIPASGGSP